MLRTLTSRLLSLKLSICNCCQINYWKLDVEEEFEATQAILHGQRDRGLIIGLEHDTFYQFNVQAYNSAGNGPKSETFRQTTFHLRMSVSFDFVTKF